MSIVSRSSQPFEGWFDMNHAALDAPGPESIYVDTLLYDDRAVLMPARDQFRLACLSKSIARTDDTRSPERKRSAFADCQVL